MFYNITETTTSGWKEHLSHCFSQQSYVMKHVLKDKITNHFNHLVWPFQGEKKFSMMNSKTELRFGNSLKNSQTFYLLIMIDTFNAVFFSSYSKVTLILMSGWSTYWSSKGVHESKHVRHLGKFEYNWRYTEEKSSLACMFTVLHICVRW